MLRSILIANRGEIACRIIKTCRRLGIKTIAVYSSADSNAQHVRLADEAYHIGPAHSQESYLCIDKIIAVAKTAKAQAVHPGYGFLSENADFCAACNNAGIVFIGPAQSAINAMASKSTAKTIMSKANIPLIPGYHGDKQSEKQFLVEAKKIGFPVLLKAAAGGGGKGMRVVTEEKDFFAALNAAKREAKSSFNDDLMLIEKYLTNPRHIELQIFADNHGNVVYLFERDCSIQRRHQKIIEEAPAPNFPSNLRKTMGEVAVKAATAINYTGAGTVEFLVTDNHEFYFMEMNTRLQVEHPVTEMITGLDLVEWQLLVASNHSLPLQQNDLNIQGHAIEVRIYAEDPQQNFLPSVGKLHLLKPPKKSDHVRIDSGVVSGDDISQYYDPLIAKLIVWDKDRLGAVQRLQRALWNFYAIGVTTNIAYLSKIIQLPAFQQANLSTDFIDTHTSSLQQVNTAEEQQALILTCLYVLLSEAKFNQQKYQRSADPNSPWSSNSGWRMNLPYQRQIQLISNNTDQAITVHFLEESFRFEIGSQHYAVTGILDKKHQLIATIDGKQIKTTVFQHGNDLYLYGYGFHHRLSLQDLSLVGSHEPVVAGSLSSPMPGTVVAVNVTPLQNVKQGASLIVVEAMKMEHTISAPSDGFVKEIFYKIGDTVDEGAELIAFEAE